MKDKYIRGWRIDWSDVAEDSYLRGISALSGVDELEFGSNITFLVGENGSGKSTLLEAIAVAFGFNAEGGTLNYRFSTYNDTSPLNKAMTLIKGVSRPKQGYFFRAETFFNVATVGATKYMGADYHTQSHGEGFLSFMSGFDRAGLYLIDEPEAALSPQRQLSLLKYIYDSAKNGAQFIIATHSPILLACPSAEILSFDNGSIAPCDYEETSSYQLTKMFMERKDVILDELLYRD